MKRDIFTKAVSAILCMAMAVSFSACNNDLNIDHTVSTNGNSTQETSETEAAATTTTAEVTEASTEDTTEAAATTTTTAEATEASTEDTTEASSEPVSSNPYERFIEDYKKALSNPNGTWYYGPDADFGGEQPPKGTVALPLSNVYEDSFSYMLYDVDGDGTQELIIGEQWEDGENWVHIRVFGLVTMIGDDYKIAAAGWDKHDLEYKGGNYFYAHSWPSENVEDLSFYEYNAEYKCLDLAFEMEIYFIEGSDMRGLPADAGYFYYEGKGGMERTDALATGTTAQEKYFAAKKKVIGDLPSDLIDREWTEVAFKDVNN